MRVDFYHLTQRPLERVLPQIAERVVIDGGRLLIVSEDEAQRAQLDQLLWSYSAESFLPHGLSDGEHAADQPVLIAEAAGGANGARNIAIVDGRWRDEALAFDRAFHLFDEQGIGAARAAWKGLAAVDGVERNYWKQNDAGRWEQAG